MRITVILLALLMPTQAIAGLVDNFNRAELGSDYCILSGQGAANIVAGAVGGTTTGENFLVRNVTYGERQYACLTLAALPGINEGVSFFYRLNMSTGNGYDFQIQRRAEGAEQNELRLFEYNDWSFGRLIGSYPWNTWTVGDRFGCAFDNTSIKCYASASGSGAWTEIINITNSTHIQAGNNGWGMFANNARWDDLYAGDDGNPPFTVDEDCSGNDCCNSGPCGGGGC